jgi:hypothetical protein
VKWKIHGCAGDPEHWILSQGVEALSYLEVKDDGPDEAECELGVPVHNVLAPDVDQLDLLVAQEAQRRLHVLDGVEAHAPALSGLQQIKR